MLACFPPAEQTKACHSDNTAASVSFQKDCSSPNRHLHTLRVHAGNKCLLHAGKPLPRPLPARHSRAVGGRTVSTEQEKGAKPNLLTVREAQGIAASRGLTLTLREIGPVYEITCRDGGEEGPIVGTSSGFTAAPFGLMHCDSLRVFISSLEDRDGRTARERGVGLGLLISGAVIAHGAERGCIKAEILAINDDDAIHARLCKYYRRMGFVTVREVGGNGLPDLPHQLVWGGVGTRMDADIGSFLQRWSDPIRNRR